MQQYKYTAVNLQKEKFTGTFLAEDEKDLAAQLARQNLYLVSCAPYSGKTPSQFFTLGVGGVNMAELTMFCRQFAILIDAGIPILGCLESLKTQPYSAFFKKLLQVIYEDVQGGMMLAEALNKHKAIFPNFFRSMVYVGEQSGKMETVFNALANYYESDAAIKRKTKSALAYPLMLIFMTIAIVILMIAYIVPTFRQALESLNLEVTGLTKAVYDISDFLLAYWQYMLVILILVAGGLFLFGRTKKGKYLYDKLKIHMPFFGKITMNVITARFARGFGILLSSGMTMVDALDTIEIVLGNKDVEERFHKAAEEVRHGESLAVAFEKYKLFPQMMLQMITVGEKSAALDDILGRTCVFFDQQVEASLTSITTKLQPILLLIMGVIIGTLFLAVYSPLLTIMAGLG